MIHATTTYPGDLALDPIRAAAASGRGLVVLDSGKLHGRVVEALRVCGRLEDLLVVNSLATLSPMIGLVPGSRNLPRLFERRPAQGAPSRAVIDTMTGLPDLDYDEATVPGRFVVVAGRKGGGDTIARQVLEAATNRARQAGAALPVMVSYDSLGDDVLADGDWRVAGFSNGNGPSMTCAGHGGTVDDLVSHCLEDEDARWRKALSAFEGGISIEGDGVEAWAFMGGRAVLARHVELVDGHYEVFEVARGEISRAVVIVDQPYQAGKARRLATLAARGGIGNHDLHRDWTCLRAAPDALKLLTEGSNRFAGPSPGARGILSRIDEELETTLPPGLGRRFIHRAVHEAGPGAARGRREFVLTWPGCADAILDPEVRGAVDAGASGTGVVARFLGTNEVAARRLVGILPERGLLSTLLKAGYPGLGAILAGLGHGSIPAQGQEREWRALIETFRAFEPVALWCWDQDAPRDLVHAIALVTATPGRRWSERYAALRQGEHRFVPSDVTDVAESLLHWLRALAGPLVSPMTTLRVLAGGNGSLIRLAKASAAWHGDRRLSAGTGGMADDAAWQVPFGRVDLGDGWFAQALANVAELRAEGGDTEDVEGMAGLSHCVGGYGPACASGKSLIVSLRRTLDDRTVRVSTVELVPGPGDWRMTGRPFRVGQHRARANAAPAAEAERKLSLLRVLIDGGKVALNAEALGERDAVDPFGLTREQALALLPAWRRVLPEPYRRMDADTLAEAVLAIEAERGG